MESSEPEKRRYIIRNKDIFEPYAPPYHLPFPTGARLTAYELLAFLPNSLRSPDIVYRFASNGASRRAIWTIVNSARDLQKEWTPNQCGSILAQVMNRAGFEGWVITAHWDWHSALKNTWDESNLEVTGFKTLGKQQEADDLDKNRHVPFKDLAVSVRRWPQGDEALDLTRMVKHCVENPDELWLYPQDYSRLLSIVGGPAPAGRGHKDRQIFMRWEDVKPAQPRTWSATEMEAAKNILETRKESKSKGDAKLKTPNLQRQAESKGKGIAKLETQKFRTQTSEPMPTAALPAALPAASTATPIATPTTTPTTAPHMGRERPKKRPRLDDMALKEATNKGEREAHVEHDAPPPAKHYTPASAKYVAPPTEATAPDEAVVLRAFNAECMAGETDMFSAYAFGGPRKQLPYRMLHNIEQPDKGDFSGWAENLRWAFEQRACFYHAMQTEGWNESPAHLEFIAQTRQKQVWASEELLEQIMEEEGEEEEDEE
ncbi:hypothetical protein HBI42_169760 [Parastagonospora nodorum]|nr:hypothetical protein HBH43_228310 [Parastagonospora nodorum]KAH4217404.1 hypothetical protein HBI06_216940 [Parastagonospora nodorum]KAH4228942.1 hypothetical protein HBI05_199940 [Parastagonospora nodorum]KAH4921269.1 hypothetical protein HBI79_187300 [Parastagonospora nodorum]KAH4978330.1 hypothetical protein HBI76_212540 [Parastagonospora nodorum]